MEITVGVKFKKLGKIYNFSPNNIDLNIGDGVIVETVRGIEYGIIVIGPREQQILIDIPLKPIIRKATKTDESIVKKNRIKEQEAFIIALEKIKKNNLPMNLLDVDFAFDTKKVTFFFTAESRIDFRELVKELASVFRIRIEMRQIGSRDEAKIIKGMGCCGREICCATFLSEFTPITIRMAKEQKLSLNASKLSGICGRFMCCLNFE